MVILRIPLYVKISILLQLKKYFSHYVKIPFLSAQMLSKVISERIHIINIYSFTHVSETEEDLICST